ncbi:2-oxo-4-hydroxy-4-carboxy-5-ureidoimidazoline decarboxylase [Halomonas denitrificans]|uniref:2-oxo-4-hydroxy-4-carboxy-5-ureidoimidazoline decarboxylase n=1 Tax=Halomonas TaxID=2745 RepID=UPI001C9853D8|nr:MULTISPECIES: 2-oxo-4-hydroxy-4-carboxy-5-ureidoimidazoline decarboxylase [Halomonas]MBY5928053.1 2-oxo-4-hydroxy-4-carboxy-5-ureidoimidazoline decarboxylase [Halomonas sp. DP8Y7-3]MBY5967400.1 2-oxo-4-hydroxy-4-carboxy-5-ureidoimidazoline decarboxylase [Halomonas denitrificans]MCA0974603.1 2-oxo-4-hydroxy-4-carboxy-5-ureidoimidazoline decarboxylase [Halomonas denitrificans]
MPTLSERPSQMDQQRFVDTYGDVFEHSPWVAERAFARGLATEHDDPVQLAQLMGEVLLEASPEEQLQVIRAHPDLAGKAAAAGELTDDSTREQAGAGLDQCTPEELARFTRLNDAYKARFGFPFIMAVKGGNRHTILAAFEQRLDNSAEQERHEAVIQINRIARFRLEARAQ